MAAQKEPRSPGTLRKTYSQPLSFVGSHRECAAADRHCRSPEKEIFTACFERKLVRGQCFEPASRCTWGNATWGRFHLQSCRARQWFPYCSWRRLQKVAPLALG